MDLQKRCIVVYCHALCGMCSVLAEFQSRKAHRVQIRDRDLFKYLCCLLMVVIGYMSAWTAVTLDHTGSRGSILQTGVTEDDLVYVVCQSKWWDYVIETGASRCLDSSSFSVESFKSFTITVRCVWQRGFVHALLLIRERLLISLP